VPWLFQIFFYVRSEYRRTQARQPLVFSLDHVKESTLSSQTNSPGDVTLEEIRQSFAELPEQLVANARAIISSQVGLPFGCMRMQKILNRIKPFELLEFPVFDRS
jgi:hypothetical protein